MITAEVAVGVDAILDLMNTAKDRLRHEVKGRKGTLRQRILGWPAFAKKRPELV